MKIQLSNILLIGTVSAVLLSFSRDSKEQLKNQLLTAPDTVTINKTKLILETYLWRDFMPISPPDGKPLRAVIKILPVNSETLPKNIIADKLWIIHKKEIWEESLPVKKSESSDEPLSKLEKVASGGPKWEPGDSVTVVVQLKDGSGKAYLLKADNQMIHRTD